MLPTLSEGSYQALHLESTLQGLPLHRFDIELSCLGTELAHIFERYPGLPGAILVEAGTFRGMISRYRLLEFLIRPHGSNIFLQEPLWVLDSYARCDRLVLPGETPILLAAQQALRRSPDLLNEPIIVQQNQSYWLLDVHELNIAHWQIRGIETQVRYERTQAQMIQSDKMANLGRLVDGVAHEILDPVSFIWGNLSHVKTYSQEMLSLLALYEKFLPEPPPELVQVRESLELDYLRHDLPHAIESIKTGAERLSKLASSLQNFCHIDEVYPKPTDLHELIDGILLLLKSRLKSEIAVIKRYDQLPPVPCFPGQLNQVFMNILSSCLDALLNQAVSQQIDLDFKARRNHIESLPAAAKPTIAITTQICSLSSADGSATRWVAICIADNGAGLSQDARTQLLESFSVKNRTGKETSLAISYQIVTAKHGGKFKVRSRCAAAPASHPISDELSHPTPATMPDFSTPETDSFRIGTEFEILLPIG